MDLTFAVPAQSLLKAATEDIILQYTYPRLDAEVSKHRNHLLKAPFCVHPKTGRICVPILAEKIHEFNPETVPTVNQLLRELDQHTSALNVEGAPGSPQPGEFIISKDFNPKLTLPLAIDWEKTSLKPYIDILDRHAKGLMEEVRRSKRESGEYCSHTIFPHTITMHF